MLKKLGFKKKIHIGISISANNTIELVCIDKSIKSVVKYSSANIKYNSTIKEIIDFDELEEVIENLFEETGLNPADCSVTLSLPNVHFGIMPFDNSSDSSYIIENLQSEIEDIYIFKKNEPVISYSILGKEGVNRQKNIVYSAIQTKTVAKIIEIFDNLQADIVRIDVSYTSILKAIQYCDRFKKFMDKEEKTNILLITTNSCCSFFLNGQILIDYNESPLAVKSFSTEEVYSIIAQIAEDSISKNNPQSLLIISETEEINSEMITKNINFQGEIDYINRSRNINDQIIDISSVDSDIDMNIASYMTIEAIGAAVSDFNEYPLNINFLPPERINENIVEVNGYEVDFYRFLMVVFGGSIALALCISLLFCGILSIQTESMQRTNNETSNNIQVFKTKLSSKNQNQKKDMLSILTKILETNNAVIDIYGALATDIPDSIYIKKYVTNSSGGIGILGESKTSESVQEFVKGLREKNNNIMLSKLSMNTKEDPIPSKIPNGFTFEIKTSNTEVNLSENENIQQTSAQNDLNKSSGFNMPAAFGNRNNTNTRMTTPPPAPVI